MLNQQLRVIALFTVFLAAGCVGTMDRILLVKGDPSVVFSNRADECVAQLLGSTGEKLQEERVTSSARAGFHNPPRSGQYFIEIACGKSGQPTRYGPYSFDRDFEVDLK